MDLYHLLLYVFFRNFSFLFVENLKELGDAVKLKTSNVVTGLAK